MKIVKHCIRTWINYLSGPVHGKWNNIKNAVYWNLGRAREGIGVFIQWGRKTLIRKKRRDLGVTIMDNMSPEKQINIITGETYYLLRNIQVAFTTMSRSMEWFVKRNSACKNSS